MTSANTTRRKAPAKDRAVSRRALLDVAALKAELNAGGGRSRADPFRRSPPPANGSTNTIWRIAASAKSSRRGPGWSTSC